MKHISWKVRRVSFILVWVFSPLNEPVPCSTGFLGSSRVYLKHKCKPVCWLFIFLFFFLCFFFVEVTCDLCHNQGERVRNKSRGRWGGSCDHIPTLPHQLKPLLSALMGEWHQHPQFLQSKADKVILLLMSHLYGEMSTGVFHSQIPV